MLYGINLTEFKVTSPQSAPFLRLLEGLSKLTANPLLHTMYIAACSVLGSFNWKKVWTDKSFPCHRSNSTIYLKFIIKSYHMVFIIYGLERTAGRSWGERNRTNREVGWRKILDACRRGGGRKILDLINFFSMFPKHIFFMFLGYFGHFYFFGLRGGEKFQTRREGGAQNFRRVLKGGRKILDG